MPEKIGPSPLRADYDLAKAMISTHRLAARAAAILPL